MNRATLELVATERTVIQIVDGRPFWPVGKLAGQLLAT
jgi:hypothetical protein